jgi:hypothetical protein
MNTLQSRILSWPYRVSKANLKKGFWVLDISGSLLRAIPHPRPVHVGGRVAPSLVSQLCVNTVRRDSS